MAPSRPACPPPDVLRAALERVLPEDWQQEVDRHVRDCAQCETLLAAFAGVEPPDLTPVEENRIRSRVGLPPQVRPVEPQRRSWWFWVPVPAAAMLILLTFALWLRAPKPAPTQMANTPVRQPEQPVRTANWRLPLEAPALKLPLGTLVWRGEDDPKSAQQTYLVRLGQALEPYRAARYEEALLRLAELSRQHPKAVEPVFYRAVSLLFLNRAAEAVPLLEQARSLPNEALSGDIEWYLAVAYERSGRWDDATAALKKVCQAGTSHSATACAALR